MNRRNLLKALIISPIVALLSRRQIIENQEPEPLTEDVLLTAIDELPENLRIGDRWYTVYIKSDTI